MNELPWFPWSNNYREDDWFLSLTMGQRWAWVALLSRANETAWRVVLRNVTRLASVTCCDPEDLQTVIDSAIANGKLIEDESGTLLVRSGEKYRKQKHDYNAAQRQQRHRDVALRGVTRHDVTPTPHHTTPQDNTEERNPPAPLKGDGVEVPNWPEIYKEVQNGFAELHRDFPGIPALKTLNSARKRLIEIRWKESGFDWPLTLAIVRSSPFLRGESQPRQGQDKPFAFNFDFVFARSSRWIEILEGKYGLPAPTTHVRSLKEQSAHMRSLDEQLEREAQARRDDPANKKRTDQWLKDHARYKERAEKLAATDDAIHISEVMATILAEKNAKSD
jgi:hypothetical protein